MYIRLALPQAGSQLPWTPRRVLLPKLHHASLNLLGYRLRRAVRCPAFVSQPVLSRFRVPVHHLYPVCREIPNRRHSSENVSSSNSTCTTNSNRCSTTPRACQVNRMPSHCPASRFRTCQRCSRSKCQLCHRSGPSTSHKPLATSH